ncbi:MAG: hypothetical protein IRY99_25480 [Isosphaeraceae bacterium]|nr:hypothetical protein [Isosphaeraceae bacterium]
MFWDQWLFWFQLGVGVLVAFVALPLVYARRFFRPFYRFAVSHLNLFLILVLLYALVYAQLGNDLGIPYLFWHEDFRTRISASLGATLLLGVLGVIAFYLDPYPRWTGRKTWIWLKKDRYARQVVAIG